jgi:NAD(P)-dependent dehydrogenase (short-subunit alcohol dehydrogenase family)
LNSAAAFPDPAKAVADVGEKTFLKRLGRPEDVAKAALSLASSDSYQRAFSPPAAGR